VIASQSERLARRIVHIEYDIYGERLAAQNFAEMRRVFKGFNALKCFRIHSQEGIKSEEMEVNSFITATEALGFSRIYHQKCDMEDIECWTRHLDGGHASDGSLVAGGFHTLRRNWT
jgi:hypothetical protein